MRTTGWRVVACAALLAAAAETARAEKVEVDFDRSAPSARQVVEKARRAAPSGARAPVGAPAEGAAPAAAADDVDRFIVVFRPGVAPVRRTEAVRALGADVVKDLRLINALAVVAPKARMESLQAGLMTLPEVDRVERDFVQNWLTAAGAVPLPAVPGAGPKAPMGPPGAAEEDPPPSQTVPWGIDRVNARGAWELTRGAGIKVAVVDTGVAQHPDLRIAGGYNAIEEGGSFHDGNGHGTHVAGTIAAVDNREGVVGVAPDATLYGVKVLSDEGSGTFADVIAGLQWSVENGMDVANFSLGASQGTEALGDAVKAAAAAGLSVIAAAGNSGGSVSFPAAYPEALAVAASDSENQVAGFSSRGPEVDIIAPGVDVRSTYPGGGYRSLSGTSMATPHVAGLAALAAARGVRGVDALREALRSAATKLPEVPDEQQGAGLVDAARLLSQRR